MEGIKIFGRWDTDGIEVKDPGLKPYINLEPRHLPKTGGHHVKKQFWKSKQNIVERFINKLMGVTGHEGKHHKYSSGQNSGKSMKVLKSMEAALETIEEKTKENPVAVLVQAVVNTAPCAEITSVEYGGIRRPQPVDVSPQRRVDLSLRFLSHGVYNRTFRVKGEFKDAIVAEIMAAYKKDIKCYSVSKKENLERQAKASK